MLIAGEELGSAAAMGCGPQPRRRWAPPPLQHALLALLLALLLLGLGGSSGVAAAREHGDRDGAFPGYKEEAAAPCEDQLGSAICEDYQRNRMCGTSEFLLPLDGDFGGWAQPR